VIKRLLICSALLLALPASAQAKTTCSSGKTDFAQGKTRAFHTTSKSVTRWYLCSARVRHPHEFTESGIDGAYVQPSAFRLFGNRLAFAVYWEDAVTGGWDAEWIDVRTGELRYTEITPDTDVPVGDAQAIAVDGDGSVAVIGGDEEGQWIGYARNGVHHFHATKLLTTFTPGDVVPDSLAYADGVVSWTDTAGVSSSMPAT
jgi:hypothetical protein